MNAKTTQNSETNDMQVHNKIRFLYILKYLLVFVSVLSFHQTQCQELDNYSIRTIVIDPGHGGKDPGALGKYCQEKEITLKLAKKIGKLISESYPEIKIEYTRNDDSFLALRDRSKFANEHNADLFLSVHCNSFPKNRNVCGIETFIMGLHKSEDNLNVAMRENAVITYEENYESKYEGYDPNSEESFIIFSMLQNSYFEQSLSFASLVQGQVLQNTQFKDRGVRQAGFWVLVGTTMPSILIEAGYISNTKDEAYIRSEKGQNAFAQSIFNAFKAYKEDVDHKNRARLGTHFVADDTTIVFKIQLVSSSNPVDIHKSNLKTIENVEEIRIDNKYKYVTGSSSNYKEVVALLQEIKKSIPDAFIIALKGETQISLQEAINKKNN